MNTPDTPTPEAELRQRERQLQAILDCVPGFVWQLRSSGELQFLNSKVTGYTGRSLEGLREPHWREVMHPDDIDAFVSAWMTSMKNTEPLVAEFRLRRFDGVFRWFRTHGTPVHSESGDLLIWCGVDIDIDDKKRAEEALRNAQTQLARSAQMAIAGELAASLADAVNQPLAAILANGTACQLWLARVPPNIERAVHAVDRIVQDGAVAGNVVAQIQRWITRSGPNNSSLRIDAVIREVLQLQERDLRENGVHVATVLDEDTPAVHADLALLEQVLVNLIRNGVDAMMAQPPGSRSLSIVSRYEGGAVVVEIADTGSGFVDGAPLYEAFYTTRPDGLGLGLAIVKSIVDSYSGRVWNLHNQPRGSIFGFSLPV
jgi:PAS domain S-box-containing protein